MTDWSRVLRFLIAGGGNTALTFAVYAVLVNAGVTYPLANACGWIVGLVCGYLLGKMFVFRDRQTRVYRSTKQFAAFTGVYVASFLLSSGLLVLLIETGGVTAVRAQLIVIPLVAAFNFLSSRYVVFNPDAVEEPSRVK